MHRHRPLVAPLDAHSPEEDLCEISMQLDQSDLGPYTQRVPPLGSTARGARFDGWVRADHRLAPPPDLRLSQERTTPPATRQGARGRGSMHAASQQFRVTSSREELRRVYSHELQGQRNTVLLKQSREFYLSGDSPPGVAEEVRQRHRSGEKSGLQRSLVQQVQVQAVNYPILTGSPYADSPKKMVPHIGKIRHLINAKIKLRP